MLEACKCLLGKYYGVFDESNLEDKVFNFIVVHLHFSHHVVHEICSHVVN